MNHCQRALKAGQEGNELLDAYLHGIDRNRIDNDISDSGYLTAGDSLDLIND